MIWLAALAVLLGGAIGGLVNALTTDNGFVFPASEESGGARILRPGILGNVAVSAIAAFVSWGLYGPDAAYNVFATSAQPPVPSFSLSTFVGAVLVGIGGARWLTAEVDKKLLRGAAVAAASRDQSRPLAAAMAVSTPQQALRAATAA